MGSLPTKHPRIRRQPGAKAMTAEQRTALKRTQARMRKGYNLGGARAAREAIHEH